MSFFSKIKEAISGDTSEILKETEEEGYVELGANPGSKESKIIVRPYILQDFEAIKPILEALREGHTVALVNIKPLKDKDLVELKRAVNKLKKTCDAIEGDIAGFGDDWIAAVPSFAKIHRAKGPEAKESKKVEEVTEYSSEPQGDEDPKIETY
ncbi:MAG TPA: cell division protein SepF [Candidatus Nanoarchaeia archaeon]|nr:cell division protein SepF [Candidatus Nanoarchaeia archaeon]